MTVSARHECPLERRIQTLLLDRGEIIIPLIALLVYANSLWNGFTLDDHAVIINNPIFRTADILSLFTTIDTVGEGQLLPLYRPFTYLTFLLEWKLHQFNPFLIRLANISLHGVNTLLLFRMTRKLAGNDSYLPVVATILFAIHPINTEGVDFNAGGRNTMLATLFPLSTWLLHHRSTETRSLTRGIGASLLFFMGLLSKESALMIAPFIFWQEVEAVRGKKGNVSDSVTRLFPYILVTGIYLYLRWVTLSRMGIQTSIIPGMGSTTLETLYVIDPLGTRLLHSIYIIPRYLWSILWPTALAPRHVLPEDPNLIALALFLTWGVLIAGTLWLLIKERKSITLFGLSWCFFFWLPTSGLFIIPIQIAERYLYAPAIGFWIIIGYLVDRTIRSFPGRTIIIVTVMGFVMLTLAAITIRRNVDWKDNLTLYTRFYEQFPDNIHALSGLGIAFFDANRPEYRVKAEEIFEKVLAIDPFHPKANRLLGHIKLDKGELERAVELYSAALQSLPTDKEAMLNRGIAYDRLGKNREAFEDYRRFLTLPGEIHHLAGGAEYAERRIRELSGEKAR
ncbi:MAG: tetratricopeptide repeat protein [Desulfuromonadia bacterium]